MSVYTNRARYGRDADVALMISDHKTTVTRTRKGIPDGYRAAQVLTAGPFVGRIEPFRQTSTPVNFDEKGTVATGRFVFIALNRPDLGDDYDVPPTTDGKSTFLVEDLLTDANGVVYRVTSPARWDGNQLELNLELRG